SEDALAPRIVSLRPVHEPTAGAQVVDAPAGEAARRVDDVVLGVAGVDADRVQLQQLAAVVLVEPADRAPAYRHRRPAEVVVEEVEHRRMGGGGAEQVTELAERVRADRVPLVGGRAVAGEAVLDVDG